MHLLEDENNKKYAKPCGHRITLLPHLNEWTCISSGYNVIKRKHELSKNQRKKLNFINILNYAEQNFFCTCVDVYKKYEGNDYDKTYEALSTFKNKKLKPNKIIN